MAKQLIGRDGRSRRRLMARQLYDERSGAQILDMVPTWACDPMPARNDAGPPRDLRLGDGAAVDHGTPDDLRWIDIALSELERSGETPVRALIIREEFCGVGTQADKAASVARKYGGSLTLRQYRNELGRALDWMRGRRAA
ncbi:hypothetical protein [Lysobacter enzymogenes]|uniref:hypothetical protein n=1 Tax=Lysobacter enzymogenes TaxID=69 RepID=UPI001F14E994|nr:hypothetical protein [Lysobacter enzymogenes]